MSGSTSIYVNTRIDALTGTQGWNLTSLTSANHMFKNFVCKSNVDLSNWSFPLLTDIHEMFEGADLAGLNLSNWDMSHVESAYGMFKDANIGTLNLTGWDASGIEDAYDMFNYATIQNLVGIQNLDFSGTTSISNIMDGLTGMTALNLAGWNTSNVTDMQYALKGPGATYNSSGEDTVEFIDVTGWNTSNVTNMAGILANRWALEEIDGLEDWNTGNVTSLSSAFANNPALTSLNLTGWDVSKVEDFEQTFKGCSSLTSLDLSTWDTAKLTRASQMFVNCTGLEILDISNFNTASVSVYASGSYVKIASVFNGMLRNCTNLQYLIIGSDTMKMTFSNTWTFNSSYDFLGLNASCKILVPQALLSTYQNATQWKQAYASRFDAIENYTITRNNGTVTVTPNA